MSEQRRLDILVDADSPDDGPPGAARARQAGGVPRPGSKWLPLKFRGISWSMLLLATFCFFMPWVNGCRKMTGPETVGESIGLPAFFPHCFFPLFLLIAILGSFWFFEKRRPVVMTTACFCAAGALLYPVIWAQLQLEKLRPGFSFLEWVQGLWEIQTEVFLPPYWVATAALVVAALYGWLEDRQLGYDSKFPWMGVAFYLAWPVVAGGFFLGLMLLPGPSRSALISSRWALLGVYVVGFCGHLCAALLIYRSLTHGKTPGRVVPAD